MGINRLTPVRNPLKNVNLRAEMWIPAAVFLESVIHKAFQGILPLNKLFSNEASLNYSFAVTFDARR
jgi:hypothetical protein